MASSDIQSLDLPGFTGGLNRDADPFQLEASESPDALNVDFGLRGAVSKRSGFSHVTTTQAELNNDIIVWDIQGGATKILAIAWDGDIWDYTGTPTEIDAVTWTAASSEEDWPVGVASLNNVLYLTNMRGDAPIKWDGTTLTVMTATIFDGTSARFPKAKYLLAAHDRIFAANVDDGTTKFRSRVHFSDFLDAETWQTPDSYIDFTPDDGQEITAMVQFGEDIVVFKNHNVQLLSGASTDSFSRFVVDSGVGTVSPRTVKPLGKNLIFFDADSGVHGFDGNGFELLSSKINDYILDGINYSYAYKAHAFVYRRKYYLSVPWGADTYNSRMFVYDDQTQAWTEYDFGVLDAAVDGQDVYAVGRNSVDGVCQLFSTLNDDGVAIEAYVRTPWLTVDGPERKARLRRADFAFSAKSNVLVDVEMFRNFDTATAYVAQTVDVDPGGAVYGTAVYGEDTYGFGSDQVFRMLTGWGGRWRTVQFKIGVTGVGDDFQLNRATLHVSSLGSVRGEA